jgi:hypothetical protein
MLVELNYILYQYLYIGVENVNSSRNTGFVAKLTFLTQNEYVLH